MRYCLALILFALSSCCCHVERKDLVLAKQIRLANNERLKKEGFFVLNEGSFCPNTIHAIKGSYVTKNYRFTTTEQAEAFLDKFVADYLQPFNANTKIRPYLQNYPLTARNLVLNILFIDEHGHPLERPYIANIRLIKGEVFYDIYDREKDKFITINNETVHPNTFTKSNNLNGKN